MESMQSVTSAHHAVLDQVGGKPLPLGYGDFAAEVEALERGAGVVDLEACGVIGVRGPDAAQFLNGIATNNVKALAIGRPQDNLLCTTKGKILHAVTILRVKEEDYLVVTEPGGLEPVATHLDNYHIQEDLQMGLAGLTRLDVVGPRATEVLRAAGLDPARLMQPYEGAAAVLAAHPLGAVPRVLVLAPAPLAPKLAEALLGAGARLAGYEAFEECRLWARVPRFGADYPADYLPAEAAVYTHIAFDKGCYVGQEVHARQHYRGHANRKLVSVDVPEGIAAGMQAGSRLFLGGENVGALTSLSRQARPRAGDAEAGGTEAGGTEAGGRQAGSTEVGDTGPVRRGIAVVRYAVAGAGAPLSSAADAPATITIAPLATDLGVAKR